MHVMKMFSRTGNVPMMIDYTAGIGWAIATRCAREGTDIDSGDPVNAKRRTYF